MAIVERMPKSGYTMREGFVAHIFVAEGDVVQKGTPMVEFETDKLVGTVEASIDATVLKIMVQEGDTYPILEPLLVLGTVGEALPVDCIEADVTPPTVGSRPVAQIVTVKARAFASPLARKLAVEYGVPLESLTGTGPNERVQKNDVMAAVQQQGKATPLARKQAQQIDLELCSVQGSGVRCKVCKEDVVLAGNAKNQIAPSAHRERMSTMRQTISRRLSHSKQTIPHAYYVCEVNMGQMACMKEQTQASYNDLLLLVTARALAEHPAFTAQVDDNELVYAPQINLGMAVSVPGGLVVPVICNASKLSLREISQQAKSLSEKARAGQLADNEMSGSCFTVSNLGSFGLRKFAAVINPPESGILAVGAVEERVCADDGIPRVCKMVTLTLSADHRIIDGAEAASFLRTVMCYLQNPGMLL